MNGETAVKEAIRQVRREAGRLRAVRKALRQVQAAVEAPAPEELVEMTKGARPLSAEAHLLGVLEEAIEGLEDLEGGLRLNLDAKTLWQLTKDWQRGSLPAQFDLRLIQRALSARKA
jgi:hypothetical protein